MVEEAIVASYLFSFEGSITFEYIGTHTSEVEAPGKVASHVACLLE